MPPPSFSPFRSFASSLSRLSPPSLPKEGRLMPYLAPADYENYGLPASTSADWITAATALINSYCRRPDLNIIEYTERLRVTSGSQSIRLSYLPLAPLGPATMPIV